MNPLISVIIPVYNHADTIKKCIYYLARQTYQPIEIIIINDGSTDQSWRAINEIIRDEEYIKLNFKIMEQPHQGAPTARNKGFKNSRGEYVIFWDADTMASPLLLEKMYQALKTNSRASYAYSRFMYGSRKITSQPFDQNKLKRLNYIDTTSLLRRVDFPGFDESLKRFQDWDLWLTLLAKNKTGVFVPEILFFKIVTGRRGISNWLPSFVYKLPWKIKRVRDYEQARAIILEKHNLMVDD